LEQIGEPIDVVFLRRAHRYVLHKLEC
jgi:hypothetical protein